MVKNHSSRGNSSAIGLKRLPAAIPLTTAHVYNRTTMTQAESVFSFEEAMRTMGVTPEKLNRLIDEGVIRASREGPGTTITRRAILDYMATVTAVGKERKKS